MCGAKEQSLRQPVLGYVSSTCTCIRLIKSPKNNTSLRYEVIVGNHGTGKSTIVQKIARETSEPPTFSSQRARMSEVRSLILLFVPSVVHAQCCSCKESGRNWVLVCVIGYVYPATCSLKGYVAEAATVLFYIYPFTLSETAYNQS